MLSPLLAVLAAVANALASALQRKAAREEPSEDNLSPRLVRHLLHRPVWFGQIASVIAGFLLQAVTLGNLTMADPVVAILWGVLIFHEKVRGGLCILLAVLAAAAVATAVLVLSRSPLLRGEGGEREDAGEAGSQDTTGSRSRGGP